MRSLLDKTKVADSFSKAAITYDAAAAFQRDVGDHLLAMMYDYVPAIEEKSNNNILDLGSGTGYFSEQLSVLYPQSELFCLDIAQGMLEHARGIRSTQKKHWLCADAEALPLANNSMNFLFSSLAIQWCENLEGLFAELNRVLSPGGLGVIATLGPKSLFELKQAWASVDGYRHVNRFVAMDDIQQKLPLGLSLLNSQQQTRVVEYDKLGELTSDLKNIGAHNTNEGKVKGLTGKTKIRQLKQYYEGFRQANGKLPASYEVYYLVLRKNVDHQLYASTEF